MVRPKVPLLTVDTVILAAVELLEADGHQHFSLRNLGAKLNVNSASIYHHFLNKEEILMAAVRYTLREIALPPASDDWKDFVCASSIAYRRLLVAKPFLIPIMLSGVRPTTRAYAIVDTMLTDAGIPDQWRPEILHTLDNSVVASAAVSVNAAKFNLDGGQTHIDHEALLTAVLRLQMQEMERQFAQHASLGAARRSRRS